MGRETGLPVVGQRAEAADLYGARGGGAEASKRALACRPIVEPASNQELL